jgi:hypothetical protein
MQPSSVSHFPIAECGATFPDVVPAIRTYFEIVIGFFFTIQ